MPSQPYVVGVTGNMGCGKSTVLKEFNSYGVPIFDMDKVAHDIYATDKDVVQQLIGKFGEKIYDAQLGINRKELGALVFGENQQHVDNRKALEAIVWPKIEEVAFDRLQHYSGLVVLEAAVLYEAQWEKKMDNAVLVYCEDSVRIQRVARRHSITHEQAEKKIALSGQMPQSEKILKTLSLNGHIINNSGTLETIKTETKKVYDRLMAEASAPRSK